MKIYMVCPITYGDHKQAANAAGIRLQFCMPAVLYIRVFCIMLDSNIRGNCFALYTKAWLLR